VVALPDQLFYNTGISTYFWIVTNRKSEQRRGKVQLVDARELWAKMSKSLGEKRKHMTDDQIAEVVRLYGEFKENDKVKVFPNESFGYLRITVERPLRVRWEVNEETFARLDAEPRLVKVDHEVRAGLRAEAEKWMGERFASEDALRKRVVDLMKDLRLKAKPLEKALVGSFAVRDAEAEPITNARGNAEPDSELRDNENVPLPPTPVLFEADATERLNSVEYRTAIRDYVEAEVLPYVPDAWVDYDKTKIGYEIPLTRHFYKYVPPRPLEEIDAEIKQLETEIQDLLREVTE
jgi:type I restriction enzyme M protein